MSFLSANEANERLQAAGPGASVYLVGIGGCGMSALGHILLDAGCQVAGSDLQENAEIAALRERGARVQAGHDPALLEQVRPVLIAFTSAVKADNPELRRAKKLGIPAVRRATLLAAMLQRQRGVCVAGMHGKTTTSALLAYVLEQLGQQPSYAVGWNVPQLERHGRFSTAVVSPRASAAKTPAEPNANAPLFVIEADESDGTLREFHPQHCVLLNVDAEHLDHFDNFEAILKEFKQFAGQSSGKIVYCADDERLTKLLAKNRRAVSYGFHALADYRIELQLPAQVGLANAAASPSQQEAAKAGFAIWRGHDKLGEFHLQLIGEKNISNAAGAIALLHQLGFTAAEVAGPIAAFQGAGRRQQELFHDARFRIFDDYGHHPTEIRATLQALRSLGGRRLLVAFQPHRYTRTQHLLKEFGTCFAAADKLWLTEIYAASEKEIPGVNSELLAKEIRAQGQAVEVVPQPEPLCVALRAAMKTGDVVVCLGAGADITKVAHQLAAQLRQEAPAREEWFLADLAAGLSRESVLCRDETLAEKTTMRVGGKADYYVEPASEEELASVLKVCRHWGVPFLMLGRGSNLLIRDGGIRGVVISLAQAAFSRIEAKGERIYCSAGASLKAVANAARDAELTGLEFLEGIPGTVGGAMRMNAGAMGGSFFEVVESVRLMDSSGAVRECAASELKVEYRCCPVFKDHVALGATLKGQTAPKLVIAGKMKQSNRKRWSSQPRAPSAGCIFKNPAAIPAGKLIEELGLKGTRVGGALVSPVHGNFIVNDGHATARDVLNLIEIIKQRAKEARGIDLETEVQIIGE